MIYTKIDYDAGRLPNKDDIFYIFGQKFRVGNYDTDELFLYCYEEDNDWAFKHLGIDKNIFFEGVLGKEYVKTVELDGPSPYTDSVEHLMKVVNALWEYSPLQEGDEVYIAGDIEAGNHPERFGYHVSSEMANSVSSPQKIIGIEDSTGDALKYGFCKTYKVNKDRSSWYWTLGMFDVPKSLTHNAHMKKVCKSCEETTIDETPTDWIGATIRFSEKLIKSQFTSTTKQGSIELPKHTKHLKVTL